MSAEAAYLLVQATIASSAAVLLVVVLRKVLRYAVGARAAYWIWLLVPAAAMVVLLPQPEQTVHAMAGASSGPVRAAVSGALSAIDNVTPRADYATAVLAVWIAGVLLSLALVLRRHRAFVRSLGEMTPRPDGSLRAATCHEPVLLGVLRPRVVLPPDFDTAYGSNERAMVLAHEQAHLRRRDPQVNAVAAMWLCLSWFNPLMYWARGLFRFDQELACDASVLALPGASRRGYADALVKTQLAADLGRDRAVMGCHWHSSHPLTERIHMLKRPLPGELRRRGGLALMLAFVVSGCYAVRTAQSQAPLPGAEGPQIAVNMKMNGVDKIGAPEPVANWDFVVGDGGTFMAGAADGSHVVDCVARLPASGSTSATGESMEGLIVLSCRLSHFRRAFATPTLIVRDGEPSSIEVTDSEHGASFRLELTASTADARIAEAAAAWKRRAAAEGAMTFHLRGEPAAPRNAR